MQQNDKLPSQKARPSVEGKKNKGGRPRKPIKKDTVITVKCTATDKTVIKGKARVSGSTASEFLRKMGLEGKVDRSERAIPKEVQYHLSVFGHAASNLNQIAMRLNKGDEFTEYLKEQLLFHFEDLKKTHAQIKAFFQ